MARHVRLFTCLLFAYACDFQNPLFACANLSQTLDSASELPCAELLLCASPPPIVISVPVQIAHRRTLIGQEGTVVQVESEIYVSTEGMLNITGVILNVGKLGIVAGLTVAGACVLRNVRVEAFAVPFLFLIGRVAITQTHFRANTETSIRVNADGAVIELESVEVANNAASFIAVQPQYQLLLSFTLTARNTRFENNSLASPLFDINNSGNVTLSNCTFRANSGKLLALSGQNFQVTVSQCEFDSNEGALLSGFAAKSAVQIADSVFRNNSGIAFDFPQFDGIFVFAASHLTQHSTFGPISLANRMVHAQCHISLLQSNFTDFRIFVPGPTPGLLSLYACTCLLSHVRIVNVTITSSTFSNLRGFIFVNLGAVAGSDVHIENSGTNGFLLAVFVGNLSFTDFRLEHTFAGAGFNLVAVVGTAQIANGYAALGETIGPITFQVYLKYPMYFGVMDSLADVRNITIEQTRVKIGGPFGVLYSVVSIRDVWVRNVLTDTLASFLGSEFSMSNVYAEQTVFLMYPFVCTVSTGQFANITLRNSRVYEDYLQIGLIAAVHASNVQVTDFLLDTLTAPTFLLSRNSAVAMKNLRIANCVFRNMLRHPFLSYVSFVSLVVTGTAMQLFLDMRSTISFEDAYFDRLYSPGLPISGYGTQLSMTNVTFLNFATASNLGKFYQGASVLIAGCRFTGVSARDQQGWLMQDGNLTITNSQFTDYQIVLFQVTSTNVTIRHSLFLNGENPTTSLISPTGYGGVLHCIDCPQVAITGLTVANVTALFGGALAFMRNKGESFVKISQSEFVACRALQGGAVFMQNVSFVIESSIFRQNVANTTGGALKAAIKPSQHAMIRHSMFTRNWATQGGGIEWSNAPVLLINTSFVENRADYGPDVASYGVALSSRLTRFQGNETSGSPLTVVFEFLDHYNHRVSLSPFVYTRLSTSPSIGFNGNEIKMYRRGWFNYSDLVVYARPGASHTITATLNYSQEDYSLALVESVKVHFRNCTAGEVYHSDHCEYCSPGYYSFSPDDRNCSFCPRNAFCAGGNQISINPGFWTSSWNSTQLFACPLPSKCLGGPNSTCAPGFTGKVCNECSAGAFRVRDIECVECWGSVGVAFQFIIPVVLYVLFIIAVLKYARNSRSPLRLFLLKSTVSHLQVISVLRTLRMSFPTPITYFLYAFRLFSSLSVADLPLSCLKMPYSEYEKAIVSVSLPLLLALICFLTSVGFGLMSKEDFWIGVSSTLLLCPVISIQTLIPLLSCFQVDSEQALLFVDMQEVCWEGTHRKLVYAFVLPSLILTVAFPLAVGLVLGCCRPEVFDQYFPLWGSGYKWRGWEVLFCVTRCGLISLSILTLRSPNLVQLCYCFCALIVMCVLNVLFSRVVYINSRCFALCECSWSVLSLSTGFLSYFMEWQPGESKGEVFFVTMVLVLNAGYVCFCGYTFVRRDSSLDPAPNASNTSFETTLRVPHTSFASSYSHQSHSNEPK